MHASELAGYSGCKHPHSTALRALCIALIAAISAHAQTLPREFTITPTELKEAPAFLTEVAVEDASCAAVNDTASLLVIGRAGKDDKHLAVFALDADGKPNAGPAWLALPKPKALDAKANYPLGLLFHPTLPLLYVWQDIEAPPDEKQEQHADFKPYLEFDHLLIFAIKDGRLEQVHAAARGPFFHCGLNAGTVGLDVGAKHLFLPNATGDTPRTGSIGVFSLDDEGLPEDTPDDAPGKVLDKATRMKARAGKDVNGKYSRLAPLPKHQQINSYFPTGTGWFPGREALVMGGYSGCLMIDLHNGAYRHAGFQITGDLTGPCSIAGHPTAPALYICLQDHNHFYQVAQTDGYVSLLPQIATITGAHTTGIPLVIAKHNCVAIGDTKALHLIGIEADGRLNGRDDHLKLNCNGVAKGIGYSDKHGRLYVAVNKIDGP